MSILDSLVNVSISISSPVAQVASFNTMLIVGETPTDSTKTPSPVAKYTSLVEITGAGWTATEPVYKSASTAFGNGATELFVAVRQPTTEVGETGNETISVTLARALEYDGWYGFVIAAVDYDAVSADYDNAALFAEGAHKLFGFVAKWENSSATSPISDKAYCFGFAVRNPDDTTYSALNLPTAMMAKAFSYDAGAETWAYKTLSGMKADTFTVNEISSIKAANLNYYIECAGRNITLDGKTTFGEWIDIIRFKDWLINDIQQRIYSALVVSPKIPYTDDGINVIFGKITASLTEGQNRGGIAQADYDDLGNKIPGFTVIVPKMASISEAQRATRVLSGIKFTARLAGAIHIVNITGTLTQ